MDKDWQKEWLEHELKRVQSLWPSAVRTIFLRITIDGVILKANFNSKQSWCLHLPDVKGSEIAEWQPDYNYVFNEKELTQFN